MGVIFVVFSTLLIYVNCRESEVYDNAMLPLLYDKGFLL
jgi:hypothetical protein